MARHFGSDNHAPVHPKILKAIESANLEHAPSYGTDSWSDQCEKIFQRHFGSEAKIYFVFNGTAANCLALRTFANGAGSILCSDISHIHVDECAAPEYLAHVKLLPLPHKGGKITLAQLQESLVRKGDQHFAQIRGVSITQPTEVGTVYSLNEIKEICDWAHQNQLLVHMDGARIANAVAYLQTSFKAMTTDLGVDIVSFGGTKNGFLFGEAVVVLNPGLNENMKYYRKQLGQLPSKSRFLAAQFSEYLGTDLWKNIAEQALQNAQILLETVSKIPGVRVTQKTQSNAVFACIPQKWVKPLREKYFFYVWDEKTFECRWMTSWDSEKMEILDFANSLKELSL